MILAFLTSLIALTPEALPVVKNNLDEQVHCMAKVIVSGQLKSVHEHANATSGIVVVVVLKDGTRVGMEFTREPILVLEMKKRRGKAVRIRGLLSEPEATLNTNPVVDFWLSEAVFIRASKTINSIN